MKKLTKEQRIQKEKDALRQRITDVYAGANSGIPNDDFFATAAVLSKVVPVLKEMFNREGRDFLWQLWNLEYYDNVESATDFLFERGVRA